MTTHPHHLRAVPDHDPGQSWGNRFTVTTQVTATGEQDNSVRAFTPITGSARPQIGVRVGRVTVFVTDRAALQSFLDAWTRAEALAGRAFPNAAPVPHQRPT